MGNEVKLDHFQEGIHCYYRMELKNCDYFENVEYRMLCRNKWEVFLPVLLREEDGSSWVLYRVDGRVSLEEKCRQGDLSLAFCREMVKSILGIMEIIRDNMMELSHVCLKPEYIFVDRDNGFHWCYLPYASEHVQKEFELLAAWLLSKVDYDDSEAVRFVYYLHWCLRKEELSETLLKNCLLNVGDSPGKRSGGQSVKGREKDLSAVWALVSDSPAEGLEEERRKEEKESGSTMGYQENTARAAGHSKYGHLKYGQGEEEGTGDEKMAREKERPDIWKKFPGRKIVRGISLLLCLVSLLAMAVLLYIGNRYQFTRFNARCVMAAMFVAACSGASFWLLSTARGRQGGDGNGGEGQAEPGRKSGRESLYPRTAGYSPGDGGPMQYADWEYSQTDPCGIEENPDENGTVVLAIHREKRLPALQDIGSGELRIIQDDPWYIGSEKDVCHLWIDSRTVSRRHAKIYRSRENDEILITDLNSTNGTKVNGITLIPEAARSLSDGDLVEFAGRQYRYLLS